MTTYSPKNLILILATLLFCYELSAQRIVCDETCKLADAPPASANVMKDDPGYAVVSPVGHPSVDMISQAERLKTLDGKTIAIVGVSFMTSVTHPEIKRLILENYPSAKVILLDEIGIAGPYPAPGITRTNFRLSSSRWAWMPLSPGMEAVVSARQRKLVRALLQNIWESLLL